MTLVTTAGASNATSYCTVAFIDSYAIGTAWAASWAAISEDEDKEAFAIRACRALDTLAFEGYPSSDTQCLQHPRTDVPNARGGYYDTTTVQDAIKRAQAHIAAWLSSLTAGSDPFSLNDVGNLSSLSVGPISMDFQSGSAADGSRFLATVIAPMLRPWGFLAAAGVVRLTR